MRMRIRVIVGLAGAVAILAFASGATAITAPGFTELISVSSAGVQGNQDSERPAMSADGRFVAFGSLSDNLVPGDTNTRSDIFVRDRMLGTTERVSVSSAGREGDAHSGLFDGMSGPSISADGRFVVFDSEATNLVKGDTKRGVRRVHTRPRHRDDRAGQCLEHGRPGERNRRDDQRRRQAGRVHVLLGQPRSGRHELQR